MAKSTVGYFCASSLGHPSQRASVSLNEEAESETAFVARIYRSCILQLQGLLGVGVEACKELELELGLDLS
ncbi:hypothetical protein M5K25_026131 [Dendrobium thyrsiflorum]|uniref:Uncharacterized protein n=1 Tax=Dendrobium thyrsiflorum TaxID=117978 RepID=A0ABD0TWR3_DENTH